MRKANEEDETVNRRRWGLLHVLGRNLWLFFLILLLTPGITAIYSYLYVPRPYRAYTTFEIHDPDVKADPGLSPSDAYLNTQIALMNRNTDTKFSLDFRRYELQIRSLS